jgi:histidinol-phosphate phosphatase family protein
MTPVTHQTTRAVFLDKDGTLIENVPFNVDASAIRLTSGAPEGLLLLARCGYRFFVVTHQPGVAFGFFTESSLGPVERRLSQLLEASGVRLDGFYYCPHSPRGNLLRYTRNCECRKPMPGLIERAAREHGIALHESWVVGDRLDDIECGRRAGCSTVLIDNGHETDWNLNAIRRPDRVASDLFEAAALISGAEQSVVKGRRK